MASRLASFLSVNHILLSGESKNLGFNIKFVNTQQLLLENK